MKVFVIGAAALFAVLSTASAACDNTICKLEDTSATWPMEESCFAVTYPDGNTYYTLLFSECQKKTHACQTEEMVGVKPVAYTRQGSNSCAFLLGM